MRNSRDSVEPSVSAPEEEATVPSRPASGLGARPGTGPGSLSWPGRCRDARPAGRIGRSRPAPVSPTWGSGRRTRAPCRSTCTASLCAHATPVPRRSNPSCPGGDDNQSFSGPPSRASTDGPAPDTTARMLAARSLADQRARFPGSPRPGSPGAASPGSRPSSVPAVSATRWQSRQRGDQQGAAPGVGRRVPVRHQVGQQAPGHLRCAPAPGPRHSSRA